jgi:hypothetical protein
MHTHTAVHMLTVATHTGDTQLRTSWLPAEDVLARVPSPSMWPMPPQRVEAPSAVTRCAMEPVPAIMTSPPLGLAVKMDPSESFITR